MLNATFNATFNATLNNAQRDARRSTIFNATLQATRAECRGVCAREGTRGHRQRRKRDENRPLGPPRDAAHSPRTPRKAIRVAPRFAHAS
jgi:hypothetical protein